MSGIKYTTVDKYIIRANCIAPLHVGNSEGGRNEVLIHSSDGMPYIQASGIAGVLRTISKNVNGEEITDTLFGSPKSLLANESASLVKVSDGRFTSGNVMMELRPRLRINPETGSVNESVLKGSGSKTGHKFDMESLGRGSDFQFTLYCFGSDTKEAMNKVLSALCAEKVQLGGQKSNGFGFIAPKEILYRHFDLTDEIGRSAWADEDILTDKDYSDILSEFKTTAQSDDEIIITVNGKTEGAILVKGIAVTRYGKDAPDVENMKDSCDDYIIPGSSFKGILRSRACTIAKYLGKDPLIDEAFGSRESSGNIIVRDAIIGNKQENDKVNIHHRIHIDKFTGGVINSGLFAEKPAFGNVSITVSIRKSDRCEEISGLVLLTLRDLAAGLVSIGSGASTGNGYMKISSINIKDGNSFASICPDKEIQDPDGIIGRYLDKLTGKEAAL